MHSYASGRLSNLCAAGATYATAPNVDISRHNYIYESCSILSVLQVSCIKFFVIPYRLHVKCNLIGVAHSIQDEMECKVMMHDSAYAFFALPSYYRKVRWHKTSLPINATSRLLHVLIIRIFVVSVPAEKCHAHSLP